MDRDKRGFMKDVPQHDQVMHSGYDWFYWLPGNERKSWDIKDYAVTVNYCLVGQV